MNKYFIKKYIDKLTKQDIIDYAKTKQINLSTQEINIIYTTIKTKWIDFLNGNQNQILKELESSLSKEPYQEIIKLYNTYQNKI